MLIWIFLGRPLAVVLIVVGALLLARFLRRWVKGRWYWPVVLTVVLGWLVLPTASALVSREGWSENGMSMGGELTYFLSHHEAGASTEAAEICGDAQDFPTQLSAHEIKDNFATLTQESQLEIPRVFKTKRGKLLEV